MTWTGEVRRDLMGELRHAAGDVIPLRGARRDGIIYLEGDGLLSWRGEISADCGTFCLECEMGSVIRGTCALVNGRYELTMTQMDKPDWALLPGEESHARGQNTA